MAYRYTNTEKWNDTWFSELKPTYKLLFLYLCDQCDVAGFLEINMKKITFDLGIGKQEAEGALKGLGRSLLLSSDGKYLFLRNFTKHQKNTPLNENNNAHAGIVKRLKEKLQIFNLKDINDFFLSPCLGANEGLFSPYGNGNGKGNGKEEGGMGETILKVENDAELSKFEKFNLWLQENCTSVVKMEQQITEDQFKILAKNFTSKQIVDTIKSMDNWKKNGYPINKLRKSVFQTFNSWKNNEGK